MLFIKRQINQIQTIPQNTQETQTNKRNKLRFGPEWVFLSKIIKYKLNRRAKITQGAWFFNKGCVAPRNYIFIKKEQDKLIENS